MGTYLRKFFSFFIVALFSLCLINATACLCRQAFAGSWEELAASATNGGVSNNTGASFMPSLALDSLGNPHIAWGD
ncbi:MAG TPA: hypothetical protein VI387_01380, partial [Candidatus Brocadiales bacterium]|nr:hypothetical protein [Candidatus Brocadiales bacterium]